MNFSLAHDLSVYQLALGGQTPLQSLTLNPATLLALVRAQIDLLIEQQIDATLWVKLPPGNIWHSELWRYQSSMGVSGIIYSCQTGSRRREPDKEQESNDCLPAYSSISVQLLPNSQLQREYFLMILSPQFCSLILAKRILNNSKNHTSPRENINKKTSLLAINTVEGKIIQRVLTGINQAQAPESPPIVPADFICPSVPEPTLMNQLFVKQLQRQEEMNRQIMTRRIAKLQQRNQSQQKQEHLKDEYLINVCQELRTPLTHIKTALSLLNSPNLKPPQRQRYLQMVNNQCDRQNSLITGLLDLLDLERNIEETKLELVRLCDIVPGVVSTYQPVAQEKGIMLAYTVPTELPAIWCVSGRLRQIVINLLHNSMKFTPNGGQVWVRARLQGDDVQLEFRDTGIGIAENEIPKIFNRFYRVRTGSTEDASGAGLGLTIVEQLLRRSGGSISVKSKLYEGSTFTVHLATVSEKLEVIAAEHEL
ncbi:signal transduction histidine kinase [Cylindrospermum stagnale PCC 7417]|uniref:histidine kinase n=1 Tax=Cylindrospermum stagnale PCC 7417 TaxID=56107 RepID=K9X0U1_9NOST|nr:DICT sensory domain-containing protein [Cylindrospermum stagnale]AFZ25392.1 signal transduction histidine kinase [Cylindrospermum stagnale PCC 7417]